MAGAIIKGSITLGKYLAKQSYKTGRVATKPVYQFTKTVVVGPPKPVIINRTLNITTRTVTVATKAGTQVRAIPGVVAGSAYRVVVKRGPTFVKREARRIVRDVLSPYYTLVHSYQFLRIDRVARGATSVLERRADRFVASTGSFLAKYKLQPRLSYTARSYIRIATAGSLIYEAETIYSSLRDVGLRLRGFGSGIDRTPSAPALSPNFTPDTRIVTPVTRPASNPVIITPSTVPSTPPPRDNRIITPTRRPNLRPGG